MKSTKRIFLGALLSVLVLSMNAQTEAGKIYLGGSSDLSFSSTTIKEKSDDGTNTQGKGTSFSLAPEAGFFVIDGLAVGLGFQFSFDQSKADGFDAKFSTTSVLVGPFVKYYYGAGNIKPFALATVGLGSMTDKETFDGDDETFKTALFGYGFSVGAAMFMNDNVALEMGVGYQSGSSKAKENNDTNERDISSGIGVNIGIVIVL